MIACLLSVLLFASPAAGKESRAVNKQLTAARQAYYEGRAADALPMWDKLLDHEGLADSKRREVMRFKAFTLFVLHRPGEATDTWRDLLVLDPTARVDPNEASPEFVEFFNGITPPPAANPMKPPADAARGQPADAQPSGAEAASAEPAANAEQAPNQPPQVGPEAHPSRDPPPTGSSPGEGNGANTLLTAVPAHADGPAPGITEPEPELEERGCGIVLCLIPFGVGQFANGSWVRGVIFSVLQVGGLATNIGMYWGQSDRVPPTEAYLMGQHAAFGVFAAALVVGILDAFLFP